jgi:type II secretory pathway component PulK
MSSHHSSRTGRTGSALLLTILTVSILLVIVLALVVMVRLELRAVGNQQDLLQARANARLGLDMAMGRLQDLAGPANG